jgi:hypothetical protein
VIIRSERLAPGEHENSISANIKWLSKILLDWALKGFLSPDNTSSRAVLMLKKYKVQREKWPKVLIAMAKEFQPIRK